jgi:uncharacterized surface protein with fasciclin (FAS1) repeats
LSRRLIIMVRRSMLAILLAVILSMSFLSQDVLSQDPLPDIVDTAIAAGSFNTLVAAVQAAGLEDTLRGEGPFTVFAPTDDAFAALPEGTLDSLLLPENLDQLTSILTYHVAPGMLMAADVVGMTSIDTVNGQSLTVTVMNGSVMIDDANIIQTDIETANGVIHVIDAVVIPPPEPLPDIVDTAVAAGSFDTLVAAVQAAGLEDTLRGEGPFTVFAPTDDAFAALPEGTLDSLLLPENLDQLTSILTYHVAPGMLMAADVVGMTSIDTVNGQPLTVTVMNGSVMIDNANIIQTDIETANGVIHVIDAVVIPPPEPLPDIVDTAVAAGSFDTLVAAVQAAGLEDTLRGEGPFTVFAPTDDAFAALPEGTLDSLLLPENLDQLTSILTYHVTPGMLMAADVVGMTSIDTVNGQPLTVTVMNGTVMIDDASIIQTDIETANGVIHVIDAVVLPEEEEDRDYTNVFFMELSEGLNMVSLPLEPAEHYDARSFVHAVEATVVIRYNTETGRFEGFTPLMQGGGFAIEGGQGYIINRTTSGVVTFVGAAWSNQPPVQAAPPMAQPNSAWAFAVTGKLDLKSSSPGLMDSSQVYSVTVRNLRTGSVATDSVTQNGSFAAVFADLNRNAVVHAGDNLEIVIKDASGGIVSGPMVTQIGSGDIGKAFRDHIMRFGHIVPEKSILLQNYPNPFNPETWIPFNLAKESDVSVKIYDASGRLVRSLILGRREAGVYMDKSRAAFWDGRSNTGEVVSSGIYFYNITAGDFSATRKMIVKK